jgi:hypothetical protein
VADRPEEHAEHVDPDESPFPVPPLEGLPFAKDSEEAEAIRRVIDEADRQSATSRR